MFMTNTQHSFEESDQHSSNATHKSDDPGRQDSVPSLSNAMTSEEHSSSVSGSDLGNQHQPQMPIINENPVISVECGAFHSVALTALGDVYCWGDNTDGQLVCFSCLFLSVLTRVPYISCPVGAS